MAAAHPPVPNSSRACSASPQRLLQISALGEPSSPAIPAGRQQFLPALLFPLPLHIPSTAKKVGSYPPSFPSSESVFSRYTHTFTKPEELNLEPEVLSCNFKTTGRARHCFLGTLSSCLQA